MLYYLISNLKDIFITIYIFKLYLIPGVQIPTKNSGSHVDPSDVHLIRLTWLLPIKKLNMVYYKDNDVIILRIGLNVCLSNLGKYHSLREIVRDISITLTNQSLYMPVNQPCWLAVDNAW